MSEAGAESFDDVKMSREGMKLLLCNDWKAAEDLFDKYKYVYRLVCRGDEMTDLCMTIYRNGPIILAVDRRSTFNQPEITSGRSAIYLAIYL